MSKSSTGAIHHFTALTLNINSLVKSNTKGTINTNKVIRWSYRGVKTGSISYELSLLEHDRYLKLDYTHTDREGIKHNLNYIVRIVGVQSNLYKGENLYFICPFTFKRCKILYSCYNSKYFKSREAYSQRIYYTSQLYSKTDRVYNYFSELDERVKTIERKHLKTHYRGKKTNTQRLLSNLKLKRENFDDLRWSYFVKSTEKFRY